MSHEDGLYILGDGAVHDLLINLGRAEHMKLHDKLKGCLIDFSAGQERLYQPEVNIVNRPEGQKILFRAFTSPAGLGTKIVVTPRPKPQTESSARPALGGIVTICDPDGKPSGILSAKDMTGYRTAMSAMIPYLWRHDTADIVVFGAGLQAMWHIRLAMALRGPEIRSITVVNRSLPRAKELVTQIGEENARRWKCSAKLDILDRAQSDYDEKLERLLRTASVVFCTVGSTSPVFPAAYVINGSASRPAGQGPLITGVGSWQPDMVEIDPDLLKHAAEYGMPVELPRRGAGADGERTQGAVVVDDVSGAMLHAGEVVQGGLQPRQILELGDIIQSLEHETLTAEVRAWMSSGLLIYKSIGVSMTDIVAGEAILDMGKAKGMGSWVSDF